MVVDESISQALNRIADNQEELNDTLKAILGHYNSVVPVMKRNSDRVERAQVEQEESIGHQIRGMFSRPQEN